MPQNYYEFYFLKGNQINFQKVQPMNKTNYIKWYSFTTIIFPNFTFLKFFVTKKMNLLDTFCSSEVTKQ